MKKTLLALACVLAIGCGSTYHLPNRPSTLSPAQAKENSEQLSLVGWWKSQEQLMTMYFFTEYRIPAVFVYKEAKFLNNYQTAIFYLVAEVPSETVPQLNVFVVAIKIQDEWRVSSIVVKEEIEFQLSEMQKEQGQEL